MKDLKTAIIIRTLLIGFIIITAAFLTAKVTLWKDKDNHTQKSNASNKTNKNVPGNKAMAQTNNHGRDYEAVPVEVTEVKKSNIEIFLTNNCTLEPEKSVDVVARTSGIAKEILVEEGDYVKSGDPLAKLDDEGPLLALKEAKVKKENAERTYNRSLENFKDNIISKEEFEDKKFQFEMASVELEKRQLEHKYTTIISPIDGVIVERNIETGYNIKKDQMAFKLADFDPILARIFVPERDLNKIEEGQTARIISEFMPEIEFAGKVKMISPVVDPNSGTIKVTVEIAGMTGGVLMPGMFVTVNTIIGQHQDALIIPKKALILESGADEVFIAKDFIVMDGIKSDKLNIGDNVVMHKQDSTSEGIDNTINGKIINISDGHNEETTSTITVEMANTLKNIESNQFKSVSFHNKHDDLLLEEKDIVFRIKTRAFKTKITLGSKEGNNAEVLTGLKEGDRIITVGQNDVGHGANVLIVNK